MARLNDGLIIKVLTEIAAEITQQAKQNASWSQDIPKAISFDPAVADSDSYHVDLKVDLREDTGAPQARAFEFGSGIHSTKGPKATYVISPKNKMALAIPFSRWQDFEGEAIPGPKMSGVGNNGFILWYVDHPGVAPHSFMTPAILAKLPDATQRLNGAVRAWLVSGLGNRVEEVK